MSAASAQAGPLHRGHQRLIGTAPKGEGKAPDLEIRDFLTKHFKLDTSKGTEKYTAYVACLTFLNTVKNHCPETEKARLGLIETAIRNTTELLSKLPQVASGGNVAPIPPVSIQPLHPSNKSDKSDKSDKPDVRDHVPPDMTLEEVKAAITTAKKGPPKAGDAMIISRILGEYSLAICNVEGKIVEVGLTKKESDAFLVEKNADDVTALLGRLTGTYSLPKRLQLFW